MNRLGVKLFIYNNNLHISSIVAGFLILQRMNKIELTIYNDFKDKIVPHPYLVVAEVEGIRIAFDTMDGYNWDNELMNAYLANVDFYFKRSFSKEKNQVIEGNLTEKMYPLGFNYHVTVPGNPVDVSKGLKDKIKQMIKKAIMGYDNTYFTPEIFETDSCSDDNGKILFMTRLWDPDIEKSYSSEELTYINNTRIEIIRKLRGVYKGRFIGGVQKDPFSMKCCPDIVIEKELTNRMEYIELMKKSSICIGSMGLHESIGWKTGEYVAAGRAIINERFHYEVPHFAEQVNYIPYGNVDECLTAVEMLLKYPDRIREMQRVNHKYYNEYLRPDKQVGNALVIALRNRGIDGNS